MSHSSAGCLRLTLLGGLAFTQLSLALRAEVSDFVIMASLTWLGGALLLIEQEQDGPTPPLETLPALQFCGAVLLLLWSLLVLSFAGRFYDVLFWLVPLASLAGLGLLAGAARHGPVLRTLLLIGLLLPAQRLLNGLWPQQLLAVLTARASAFLLWLLGTPAYPEGPFVVLRDQVLLVDDLCTGTGSLTLGLATLALLMLILPIPPGAARPRLSRPLLAVLAVPLVVASGFLINALRIALLALTLQPSGAGWPAAWGGFDLWHNGPGARLFALLSSLLVCGAYGALLERSRRRQRLRQRPGVRP